MNPIEFGKFMASLRNEKNLTQEELAEMLYIDKRKVSRWECGTSIPDFDMLIKLSKILDVSLYELSICQRIKDESLNKRIINKFKSIKDYRKYNIKKKITIIIAILIGIFFALTTIYTIDNYNSVQIYELRSLDENYYIEGNYTKAKDYSRINITKVVSLNTDENIISKKDFLFEIYCENIKIISQFNNKSLKEKTSKTNDILNFSQTIVDKLSDNKPYTIKIFFDDTRTDSLSFDFIMLKKYDSKHL